MYITGPSILGLAWAIARVDPLTGGMSLLVDATDSQRTMVYDPYRDRLLIGTDRLRAVDANGTITALGNSSNKPEQIASRDDGIVYMYQFYGVPNAGFEYLDTDDTVHPLLNEAGTGQFLIDLTSSPQVIYDPGSNRLVCARSYTGDLIKFFSIPLTPDGTQVAGPVIEVIKDVDPGWSEVPVGCGRSPQGILFVIDTNSNDGRPRLQVVDPETATPSTFATTGPYGGAAVIDAGTYSITRGQAMFASYFTDVFRAYSYGESGSGTTIGSFTGHAYKFIDIYAQYVPEPEGACCLLGGTCSITTEPDCLGAYQGDDSSCSPNPCPQPGACCLIDGTCLETLESVCSTTGGSYEESWQGEATSCSPNPCQNVSGLSPSGEAIGRLTLTAPTPNPSHGVVQYEVGLQTTEWVRSEIFDASGRRVDVSFQGLLPPGVHTLEWSGDAAVAGTYFVRVTAGGSEETRSFVLIR